MPEIKVIVRRASTGNNNIGRSSGGIRRAAAYCRVSTLQEHQEDSFETQRAYYTKFIASNPDMTLAGIYGDHAATGLSMKKRPEFKRLIDDCMAGKIDIVLTKSISRFARNLKDCVDIVRLLKSRGIPVIFEKEDIDSSEPSGELLFNLLASAAEEESGSLSSNIRWAQEQRNSRGSLYRITPYGYRKALNASDEEKKWCICKSEAKRIRMAFDMAAKGYKNKEIRLAMNELEEADGTRLVWSTDRLRYLLRNEAYTGDVLTNKKYSADMFSGVRKNKGQRSQYYIEEHHEPIVSRELFDAVQKRLANGGLRRNIININNPTPNFFTEETLNKNTARQ